MVASSDARVARNIDVVEFRGGAAAACTGARPRCTSERPKARYGFLEKPGARLHAWVGRAGQLAAASFAAAAASARPWRGCG